ncbi:NrfD/PsrC family molybdoenzyme membrane anchor subunit [Adlercreutzia sp. ZJ473]|uniref:NrfD/PsrC family molybdoenzyme membrane anchor subunit n=1 Tax=Adlercreutzia sp. ZJ473 TaxID=2722822 RepID=UPI0015559019|nr:NrfD/PsrC family molybdoenzyme membrane anchor subunit [Adlercreutzia sp. ZJ473]
MTALLKKPAFVALVALALVGIGCWIYQLASGLGITGMSNANSWGLYIMMFMLFVGLSAGGLIVASSASVFHIERFKAVAMPAVILSTACICVAGMFVLIDVGGIQRVWWMLVSPNPTSPLLWDMCVITLYLVINIIYLVFMSSKKEGAERKVAIVSRFALPIAILVHSVTAWIFGLQIAKEGWYTAVLAPIFVASAMDSGLALLLCVLAGLRKAGKFDVDQKLFSTLAGLLATCIAVDAFFIGCEVLTMAYPGAAGAETLAIMATGPTAPFFWFEVIGGLVVPFCILVFAKNREKTSLVVASSALVILGVFCKRIWLLLTSFVIPNVEGAPGMSLGTFAAQNGGGEMWSLFGSYCPTLPEILIALGAVSVGAIIFYVIAQNLMFKKETAASAGGKSEAPSGSSEDSLTATA